MTSDSCDPVNDDERVVAMVHRNMLKRSTGLPTGSALKGSPLDPGTHSVALLDRVSCDEAEFLGRWSSHGHLTWLGRDVRGLSQGDVWFDAVPDPVGADDVKFAGEPQVHGALVGSLDVDAAREALVRAALRSKGFVAPPHS